MAAIITTVPLQQGLAVVIPVPPIRSMTYVRKIGDCQPTMSKMVLLATWRIFHPLLVDGMVAVLFMAPQTAIGGLPLLLMIAINTICATITTI